MASVHKNQKAIQENRKKVFTLEHLVAANKASSYLTRSMVKENQASINRNYVAAFEGNRQLANANTDEIFHNRTVLMRNLGKGGKLSDVQENLRNALINQAKLEYLDHRSALNAKVNHINEKLAAVNAQLIDVNHEIMAANEEVVQFNAGLITDNASIIKTGMKEMQEATPQSNEQLIAKNTKKIDELTKRVAENQAANKAAYEKAQANRKALEENTAAIYTRRQQMESNGSNIDANATAIAEFIAAI